MRTSRTLGARYFDLLRTEVTAPKNGQERRQARVDPVQVGGQTFVRFVDEDDEAFFHLGIACNLAPEWEDVAAATARANDLNSELKAVKITVRPETKAARFHVEAFLDPPATAAILERRIGALRNAVREFFALPRERRQLDA